MKITKLEHSAICVEHNGRLIAIDPGCMTSEATRNSLRGVDGILVSHRHDDHFHEATLTHIGAPVYGPPEVVQLARACGCVAESLYVDVEKQIAGFGVTAVVANHGPLITNPVQNYGFVIRTGASAPLFITGDVAGERAVAAPARSALVVIPIEGGGFVFGAKEAAAYLRHIGHAGIAIGVHTDDPAIGAEFTQAARSICEAYFLNVGQTITI